MIINIIYLYLRDTLEIIQHITLYMTKSNKLDIVQHYKLELIQKL